MGVMKDLDDIIAANSCQGPNYARMDKAFREAVGEMLKKRAEELMASTHDGEPNQVNPDPNA